MITDFEERLAEVLGSRLAAPFAGRVDVATGGEPPGGGPAVTLGTVAAEPLAQQLGSPPERVPGAQDRRRVLHLRCTVSVEFHPGPAEGRAQQVRGMDAALYLLDAPDLRNGSALAGAPDPGFLVHELEVTSATAPLEESDGRVAITVRAEGLFWPVGLPGQAGDPITEVRTRQALVPLTVMLAPPVAVAGGGPLTVTVRFVAGGGLAIDEDGVSPLPVGRLALTLQGRGGKPGAGTLQGGEAGPGGSRLVTPAEGVAVATYLPPADAAFDTLVVSLEDAEGAPGLLLERVPVRVVG